MKRSVLYLLLGAMLGAIPLPCLAQDEEFSFPPSPVLKPFEVALPTLEVSIRSRGPTRVFFPGIQGGLNIRRCQVGLRCAIQGLKNTKVSLGSSVRYHFSDNSRIGRAFYAVAVGGVVSESETSARWGLGIGHLKRTHKRISSESESTATTKISGARDYYGNFRVEVIPFIESREGNRSFGVQITFGFGVDIGLPAPKPKKKEGG